MRPIFEIDFSEIEIIKHIAEGGFGVIYKGKWRESIVAVKVLKPELMKEENIKDFLCELNRRVCSYGVFKASEYSYVYGRLYEIPQPRYCVRVLCQ